MEKLILIDGNSLMNRAFYATPVFTTKDGTPTNGVFGFIKLVLKIINDKKPTHFAVAFDLHAPTFRHKKYADYKAGRKPMPEELAMQMPIIKEVLSLMQIKICELAGYEADDLLGTLSKQLRIPSYIYTGDRDAYQLVDEYTNVCYTRKGVSDILELTAQNFKDEIGLKPSQIIELKALMGDKSDNIPGVAGIGEKTAYSLLETYGGIDGIYQSVESIKGALQTKLINGKENAYFSKELATIDRDVPFDVTPNDCILRMPFSMALKEKFAQLEFKSLLGLDIFAEDEPTVTEQETTLEIVEESELTIAQAMEIINAKDVYYVACDYTPMQFRFAVFPADLSMKGQQKEYALNVKVNLLDTGFFENEFQPLFKAIFSGEKRVICYNAKETMHRLRSQNIAFLSEFDDVSILKCIVDGLQNVDTLNSCLGLHLLNEKYPCVGLGQLLRIFKPRLNEREEKLYNEVELPLVRVLYDMEKEGICVNLQTLEELSSKYRAELAELTNCIYALAGEQFNINSTQQLGRILFEKLKIGGGIKKKKDGKSYKTTAEELEKYVDESPIIPAVLRFRTVQKINSTYLEGYKSMFVKNGKVHTTYSQTNTSTGRLSSSNPNIQNIPIRTQEGKYLRKMFTASKGNVLIDADYSQIELRLLAHFSGCKELIEAYCSGKDIHTTTASQVFGVPMEEVTPEMRRDAKAVNFGIIYGISAFGLSQDLAISAKRAQEYIDKYFEAYSNVKEYMNLNVQTATRDGYVTTLLGRKRIINEIKSSNYNLRAFGERAAMNMPLQGSSADIIKISMINTAKKLKEGGYKAKLVLQVHDELVIDCPIEESERVQAILKTEMENAVSLSIPLTVEVGVGENWYDCK